MSRIEFHRHLAALQDELLTLGKMVDDAMVRSMEGLTKRDLALSEQVVRDDDLIDRKRFRLEEQSIQLLATQQPAADDLRILVAVLHIAVELERMGDYAEGISKISLMLGSEPWSTPVQGLEEMAAKAIDMLRRSLDTLVRRDTEGALQVCQSDDEVDAIYDRVVHDLMVYMTEEPQAIHRTTLLLWVAHDLERIADRATNVAERVVFLVTGKMIETNTSRY